MENSMEVPQKKLKIELLYDPAHIQKGWKLDQKESYTNVHCNTIYDSQDMEVT